MPWKTESDGEILTENHNRVRSPGGWNVVVLNDDYSTMDFVIFVFETVFHHTPALSHQLMLKVHTQGRAVAGTFTRDIAETKVDEVITLARGQGQPLMAILEPA